MSDNNRLWDSVTDLHTKIDKQYKILIINTEDLKYHIKRTDLLEEKLGRSDNKVNEMATTQKTYMGIIKFVAAFIATSGIILSVMIKLKLFT